MWPGRSNYKPVQNVKKLKRFLICMNDTDSITKIIIRANIYVFRKKQPNTKIQKMGSDQKLEQCFIQYF